MISSIPFSISNQYTQYWPYQNRVVYTNGRWWIFYASTSLRVISTADGTTWVGPTTVMTTNVGNMEIYAVTHEIGTNNVHIVTTPSNTSMKYRKLTLNADGSVTFAAVEQAVETASPIKFATIGVDGNGYPFICYTKKGTATITAERSPTAASGTFSQLTRCYSSNDSRSYTSTAGATLIPASYGFTDPGGSPTIDKVEVGVEGFVATGGDDDVNVQISWDGGATWSTAQTDNLGATSDRMDYFDFTADTAWDWTKLNNTNLKVRLTTVQVGGAMSRIDIDWVSVRVSYTGPRADITPHVTKSSTNDGTWTTDSGYPLELNTTTNANWTTGVGRLSGSKMMVAYGYPGATIKYKILDGTWGGEGAGTQSSLASYKLWKLATNGTDTWNIAYGRASNYDMAVSVNGTDAVVYDAAGDQAQCFTLLANGDAYSFYELSGHVYEMARVNGTWSGPVDWGAWNPLGTDGMTAPFYLDSGGKRCLFFQDANDAVSPFDYYFVTVDQSTTIQVTDTLGFTDAVAVIKVRKVTDNLGFADIIKGIDKTLILTDHLYFTDDIIAKKVRRVTDSLTFTDAVLRGKLIRLADNFNFTDIVQRGYLRRVTDDFSFDDVPMLKSRECKITDGLAFTDAIVAKKLRVVTDHLYFTDAVWRNLTVRVSDALGFTDGIQRGYLHRITDGLGFTDTIRTNKTLILSDALTFADHIERGYFHRVSDDLTFTDAVTVPQRSIYIQDQFRFTDNVSKVRLILIPDSLSFIDAIRVSVGGVTYIIISDQLTFNDALRLNKTLILTDALSFGDIPTVMKYRRVSDSLSFLDGINRNRIIVVTDNMNFIDGVRQFNLIKISDALTFDDTVLRGKVVHITDRLEMQDELLLSKMVLIQDRLDLVDDIIAAVYQPQKHRIDYFRWWKEYRNGRIKD